MAISLAILAGLARPALAQVPPPLPVPEPIVIRNPITPAVTPTGSPSIANPLMNRTVAQVGGRVKDAENDLDFSINLELPGPDRFFRRESEKQFFERIRQDAYRPGQANKVMFPEEVPLTKETWMPRRFEPRQTMVAAMFVNHGRLLFEQSNLERQGWDLGILTPLVSLGTFYYDIALYPYHFWSHPCQCCDSSAGKCLPGDSTPLFYYWEEFSWTGLAGQAGTMAIGFVAFP